MSILKTDYKDDVINEELASDRKFGEVNNEDGTKSYTDVTPYRQEGDEYGAKEINFENTHTNYAIEAADRTYEGVDLTMRFAEEIAQFPNPWRWIKTRIAAVNFDGLHVGDYIPIYIGDQLIKMQIAGVDTYYNCDSQMHHIDWISKECFDTTIRWSTSSTPNNNGNANENCPYNKSNVKSQLNSLVSELPVEIQEVVSSKRFLLESRYAASQTLTESTSYEWCDLGKLWLPSEYEVVGAGVWSSMPYGAGAAVQYPIFANSLKNRIKMSGDTPGNWWTLSVCGGSPALCCYINDTGISSSAPTNAPMRVPICFRISE